MLLLATTGSLDQVAREGQLGPGFWPRLTLLGLGAACLAKAVEEWRRARAPGRPKGAEASPRPPISRATLLAAIGLIVAYVALTPLLGFPLTTAGFVIAFLRLSGMRSAAGLLATTVAGTVGLLLLFVKVVYLPLPKGDGPFEAVTLALYRLLRIF